MERRESDREGAPPSPLPLLWRSRWLIGLGAMVGGALAVLQAAAKPNMYMSTAKVVLRAGGRELATPEEIVDGSSRNTNNARTLLLDEIQILDNPAVFEHVAREVGPEVILSPYDPFKNDGPSTSRFTRAFHELQAWLQARGREGGVSRSASDAALALQRSTSITVAGNSSTILINHVATSPETAQITTQALLEALRERHVDVYRADPNLDFLRDSLNREEAKLHEVEGRKLEFERSCQTADHVRDVESLPTRIAFLEADLEDLLAQRAQREKERLFLEQELVDAAVWIDTETFGLPQPNPEWLAYQAQLTTLVDRRNQLLIEQPAEGDTPSLEARRRSSDIAQLNVQIEEVRKTLEEIPQMISPEPVIQRMLNPDRQALERNLLSVKQELEGLNSKIEVRSSQKIGREHDYEVAVPCTWTLEQLNTELENRQASVKRLRDALETEELKSRLDSAELSNLRVIQEASLPLEKIGPSRKKTVALGLGAGAGIGLALALLLGLLGDVVRDQAHIGRRIGLEEVGSIPNANRFKPKHLRS